eukprot:Pgem_evm3s2890
MQITRSAANSNKPDTVVIKFDNGTNSNPETKSVAFANSNSMVTVMKWKHSYNRFDKTGPEFTTAIQIADPGLTTPKSNILLELAISKELLGSLQIQNNAGVPYTTSPPF